MYIWIWRAAFSRLPGAPGGMIDGIYNEQSGPGSEEDLGFEQLAKGNMFNIKLLGKHGDIYSEPFSI